MKNLKLFILTLIFTSNLFAVKIVYDYDSLNRLTETRYETGLTINYGYDPAGNLTDAVFTGAYDNVFYVSPDGSHLWPFLTEETAATNIETALELAGDGDAVVVNDGIYYLSRQLTITGAILLISVNGPEKTIIDGQGLNRCVYLGNELAEIQGFTITNGYVDGELNSGAGVWIQNGGTIDNCIICGNSSAAYAGGVFCEDGGIILDSVFYGNKAYYGGGLYCKFGGIVEQCEFYKNSARGNGGGICCESGGLILNCTIYNNSTFYGDGAGIYSFFSNVFRSCLVYANTAARFGGGISLALSGLVQNCTISMNSAGNGGDGVYCWNGGQIENTIIYFNDGQNYLNVGTNWFYEYSCTIPAVEGEGNISSTPGFVNNISLTPDFHLQAGSPCIDKGKNKAWMNETTDIDGDDRILGGKVDIGADERN